VIKLKAHAKVNLFLEVTGKRPDGFHDLATVFARVSPCDELTLRRGRPGIRLKVKGGALPGLGSPEDNLVYKAAARFFDEFKLSPALEMTLKKVLPAGAGLGGGSSDAAAALLGLCRLYKVPVKPNLRRLMKLAAGLGSDVPFFMLGARAAAARGRGEKLRPLAASGPLPALVIVFPGNPVFTKEVFSRLKLGAPQEIKRREADYRRLCRALSSGRADLAPALFNRLEEAVLPFRRDVRQARQRLLAAGCEAALMSGSGACVYGLFKSRAAARRAAAALKCNRGYTVYFAEFC
jgi:4-diphosphocytidyl-2-C-methyl-D-erythritol kinase